MEGTSTLESMEVIIEDKNSVEKADIDYIHVKAKEELEALSGDSLFLIGAGGFLGYYFTKAILAWNDKTQGPKITLTALSSFRKGVPSWLKAHKKRKDLIILKKDITTYVIPKNHSYGYVIHAASIASPILYRQYPIETINANVQGIYTVLNYMVDRQKTPFPVKGLLYFSSSEVYGDPTPGNVPTPEDYRGNVSCTGPRACYDESKRFCETLCVNYAQVHKLAIKIARPFNNYGPGMKITDGRVIADFSKNILSNEDVIMYSSGSPSRTFCYVADAIIGYLKILTKGKNGASYNIGVEKPEVGMEELALLMTKIAKKRFYYKGKVITQKSSDKDYLIDNPQRRCPVIKKAHEELGYKPQISLEEGLERTMVWYHG